jgi:hypothetical protein
VQDDGCGVVADLPVAVVEDGVFDRGGDLARAGGCGVGARIAGPRGCGRTVA